MKMNITLDKETQKELASEGFSFHRPSCAPSIPSYIIEAAKKVGKIYDPVTKTFIKK